MEIDRRTFAARLAAFLALAPLADARAGPVREAVIAATVRRPDGSFAAVLYDLEKGLLNAVALPARGHDAAVNPVTGDVVAFARRPGAFAVAFSRHRHRPPVAFTAPPGRHFYGHGVFSRDGRRLYTTENDIAAGAGLIGIWDVDAGYRRIGEHASHGIGPHDINIIADARTLVVANGGIITHPDHGREPLNLATMRPSLAYIDRHTGDLLELHELPPRLRQSSIRHLDVGAGGTVVFGCQFKGARTETVDLVGFHRPGEEIELLSGGPDVHRALRHYVSSIAIDRSGALAAVTSSRGGRVVLLDVARRAVVATRAFPDVSGVAPATGPGGLVVTGGGGDIARIAADGALAAPAHAAWAWDNHAAAV